MRPEPDLHSVFEEPQHREPGATSRYGAWLDEATRATSSARRLRVAAALALCAGPWAILGALWASLGGVAAFGGVMAVVVVGPLAEEVGKVAAALWVVERRPHLFASRGAIVATCAAAGLVFAAIENLLYLEVYVPDPPDDLVVWRWTVCVALHVGCATLGGGGVARVWSRAMARRERPEPGGAFGFIVAAAVVHGAYNGLAVALSAWVTTAPPGAQ